ncbi:MAG TPA: metallophosphoesterase [Thermodesulfobacteriota bacterium]|nr:metallophosphoesterase [Thermodesulfobacteriota bacterium]
MNFKRLIDRTSKIIEKEPRLVQLPSEGKVVFVGDTHGDLEASQRVTEQYLKKPYRVVFLGDYVDRGDDSEANIQYLLGLKLEHPEEIFLLAGNHEGFMVKQFQPSSFWSSISPEEREGYGILFSKFPVAATTQNGILAVHGALPEVESLDEINKVGLGDENWDRMVWGDFAEEEVDFIGDLWGRPQFGRPYFERMMERYQKQLLVRSHQPHAPLRMFNNRCITIFTSHAYLPVRTVAIADLEKEIRNSEDLALERI